MSSADPIRQVVLKLNDPIQRALRGRAALLFGEGWRCMREADELAGYPEAAKNCGASEEREFRIAREYLGPEVGEALRNHHVAGEQVLGALSAMVRRVEAAQPGAEREAAMGFVVGLIHEAGHHPLVLASAIIVAARDRMEAVIADTLREEHLVAELRRGDPAPEAG